MNAILKGIWKLVKNDFFSHTVLKLRDLHSTHFVFQNKQGPPPHPYVPRNGTGRAGGKPPTARGHVKKVKGKKGKKGKKDQYDLIVNIDLVSVQYNESPKITLNAVLSNI